MSNKKITGGTPKFAGQLSGFGLNKKELFPRSKIKRGGVLSPYQRRKVRAVLAARGASERVAVLAPDRPDIYLKAGFTVSNNIVYASNEYIKIDTLFYAEGESEFYRGTFRGAVVHAQLIPTAALPDYIRELESEETDDRFYDKIALREGDRNMHGGQKGFDKMYDSAEELRIHLERYLRHGALSGQGGETFGYIQVCFINFTY